MSRDNTTVLSEQQVSKIKRLAYDARKRFGVALCVPIGRDIRLLLEEQNIIICKYPFPDTEGSHTYGNITWMKMGDDVITFIGLNTSSYYDEQIFALAHELYHFLTKTGKAYTPERDVEDKEVEKMADRFAAELLLPEDALKEAAMLSFDQNPELQHLSINRIIRLIARIQCEWWLPYQAIVNRLHEEGLISDRQYDELYMVDCRSEKGIYRRLLRSIDSEISELLNKKTGTIGISSSVMEAVIKNYEDGYIGEDEFIKLLTLFGGEPGNYCFDMDAELDDDLAEFIESGDDN